MSIKEHGVSKQTWFPVSWEKDFGSLYQVQYIMKLIINWGWTARDQNLMVIVVVGKHQKRSGYGEEVQHEGSFFSLNTEWIPH